MNVQKVFEGLGRILVVLLSIILALSIILLPLSTSVPAWVWILLGIFFIALIILPFRMTSTWKSITARLSGMTLVSILAIVASQVFAATPPIMDVNGEPLPNSIASLEKVNLNGSEQWITIRGQDMDKPILLNLGMGGPGGGGFATLSLIHI